MNIQVEFHTTWGPLCFSGSRNGWATARLAPDPDSSIPYRFKGVHHSTAKRGDAPIVEALTSYLTALFSPQPLPPLPPIVLPHGTLFQQRVWRQLLAIPAGHRCTYGELARAIGQPNASRAVGHACGRNPLPILIPCHRVVARNGAIGGFSAGVHWKTLLLHSEGSMYSKKVY